MSILAESRAVVMSPRELRENAMLRLGDRPNAIDRMTKAELCEYVKQLRFYPIALDMRTKEVERIQALACDLADKTDRFYDAVPVGFFVLDKTGHILNATVAGASMLGLERADAVGKLLASFVVPDDRPAVDQFLKWLHHTGAKQTCKFRLLSEKKTAFMLAEGILGAASPGREERYSLVLVDITKYSEAEQAVRDRETLYRSLFDNIDFGVLLMDTNYKIVAVNAAACKICGQAVETLVGRKCCRAFTGQDEICSYCPGTHAMATGETTEVEVPRTRPDGAKFISRLKAIPMRGPDGNLIGFMELAEELTEQRRVQEQLREFASVITAKNQALMERTTALEQATLAKDDFLANMSHELRTPLNAVIGFSDGLLDRTATHPLNEHQIDRVRRIKSSGEYLLTLVNRVLDVPKMRPGSDKVDVSTFDVEELARDAGRAAEGLLHGKATVRFLLDVEPNIPPMVSDRNKLRQILSNLLGNAAKFTERGTISLMVRRQGQTLMIRVEDTGKGIPEKHLCHVFDKFYQAPNATTASSKGSGLGLTICKTFCEMLGGQIFVQSVQGKGTQFTVVLPLVFDDAAARSSGGEPDAVSDAKTPVLLPLAETAAKILCIESDAANMGIWISYLAGIGYQAVQVAEPENTVAQAVRSAPEAILLDLTVPGSKGLEVLNLLKLHPETQGIPVVVVSSFDEEAEVMGLGAAGFLRKPVSRRSLLDMIQWVAGSWQRPKGHSTDAAPPR